MSMHEFVTTGSRTEGVKIEELAGQGALSDVVSGSDSGGMSSSGSRPGVAAASGPIETSSG